MAGNTPVGLTWSAPAKHLTAPLAAGVRQDVNCLTNARTPNERVTKRSPLPRGHEVREDVLGHCRAGRLACDVVEAVVDAAVDP